MDQQARPVLADRHTQESFNNSMGRRTDNVSRTRQRNAMTERKRRPVDNQTGWGTPNWYCVSLMHLKQFAPNNRALETAGSKMSISYFSSVNFFFFFSNFPTRYLYGRLSSDNSTFNANCRHYFSSPGIREVRFFWKKVHRKIKRNFGNLLETNHRQQKKFPQTPFFQLWSPKIKEKMPGFAIKNINSIIFAYLSTWQVNLKFENTFAPIFLGVEENFLSFRNSLKFGEIRAERKNFPKRPFFSSESQNLKKKCPISQLKTSIQSFLRTFRRDR